MKDWLTKNDVTKCAVIEEGLCSAQIRVSGTAKCVGEAMDMTIDVVQAKDVDTGKKMIWWTGVDDLNFPQDVVDSLQTCTLNAPRMVVLKKQNILKTIA